MIEGHVARLKRAAAGGQQDVEQAIWDLGVNPGIREFPAGCFKRIDRQSPLSIIQYPPQFSAYIMLLRQYRIESYLELGLKSGGSFVATCELLSGIRRAVGVDKEECPGAVEYATMRPGIAVHRLNTRSMQFVDGVRDERFDLAMVDADHRYDPCFEDTVLCMSISPLVALHDIVDQDCWPVAAVWRDIRQIYPQWIAHEFVEQPPGCPWRKYGIGLLIDPQRAAARSAAI